MNQLYITFDGPRISEEGVPVDNFVAALGGIRDAMRLMVQHLGGRQPGPGQPPKWVRDQSALRLAATGPGSFVAELTLQQPVNGHSYSENYGLHAFDALLNWDGTDNSTLPKVVTDKLQKITSSLPNDTRIWFGDSERLRRVEVMPHRRRDLLVSISVGNTVRIRGRPVDPIIEYEKRDEVALLRGWLNEVNWQTLTAQLHQPLGRHVPLRFAAELGDDMRRLATQYVEVRGRGWFDKDDMWTFVRVEKISGTRSGEESFDLDDILNDPAPKIFDPEKAVTIDLTDEEWDSFNRAINEGREA